MEDVCVEKKKTDLNFFVPGIRCKFAPVKVLLRREGRALAGEETVAGGDLEQGGNDEQGKWGWCQGKQHF